MKYFNKSACSAAVIFLSAFPARTSSSFCTNRYNAKNFIANTGWRKELGGQSCILQNEISSGTLTGGYGYRTKTSSSRSGSGSGSGKLVVKSFSSHHESGDVDNDGSAGFAPAPLRFRRGNPIQVEVTRFGPLGASVEVIAKSHNEDDLIPPDEPPMAYGLVLQSEIGYYRSARGGLDVVVGEILPAYVNWVRDDGKVDITLRKPGGKGKAEDLSKAILEEIKKSPDGELPVGDKSSPQDINRAFPGASKAQFKRAVALLYKKGLVRPGPHLTKLM